ncbi:hypothetical protein BD410DRAFT_832225 [Rickenella mellea]|uniref:F-box domain-containing protein n=1 Tax=Rickenella mellea TaxID=50990 RepID=A0A4Y7PKZ6_9AGAM|nr:hypothetical protein BD410DRAFT_832225 [Rickenella mellea]
MRVIAITSNIFPSLFSYVGTNAPPNRARHEGLRKPRQEWRIFKAGLKVIMYRNGPSQIPTASIIHSSTAVDGIHAILRTNSKEAPLDAPSDSIERDATPPISRLPPELLGDIMTHSVDADEYAATDTVMDKPPFKFLLVNRQWQMSAISNPNLWAIISIALKTSPQERSKIAVEKVRAVVDVWLRRSGSLPLTILLVVRGRSDEPPFDPVMDILLHQSWRWKILKCDLPIPCVVRILETIDRGEATQLVGFDVAVNAKVRHGPWCPESPFQFSNTPRLSRFSLSRIIPRFRFGGTVESLRSLDLSGSGVSSLEFKNCIKYCARLKELAAFLVSNDEPFAVADYGSITHTQLQEFTIRAFVFDPGPILDFLILPALRSLAIATHSDTNQGWPHLQSLLVRSQPRLEALKLVGTTLTESELLNSLRLVPHLNRLELIRVAVSHRTIGELTPGPLSARPSCGNVCLCPNIKSLYIDVSRVSVAPIRELLVRRYEWCLDDADGSDGPTRMGCARLADVCLDNICWDMACLKEDQAVTECMRRGLQLYDSCLALGH